MWEEKDDGPLIARCFALLAWAVVPSKVNVTSEPFNFFFQNLTMNPLIDRFFNYIPKKAAQVLTRDAASS